MSRTIAFRQRGTTRRCLSWLSWPAWLRQNVSRDMKLHSILLGWTGFLTKPCVSPQVFHGSTRLTGCPERFRGYCPGCGAFPEMYLTW